MLWWFNICLDTQCISATSEPSKYPPLVCRNQSNPSSLFSTQELGQTITCHDGSYFYFTNHDGFLRSRKGGFCRKWNQWLWCTRDVAHTYGMWYIYNWYLHISYRWYRDTGIYNILEPWHRYISYIDDIYSRAIHISYIHNLYFNETHESTFTCFSSFYYVCCNKNHSRNVLTSHAKRGIYAC